MPAHIDGYGQKGDRRAVTAIQRLQGSAARKARAQEKRDRRRAKRAHGPDMILLLASPPGGVSTYCADGAYIARGVGKEAGLFQIIVVGTPRFTDEQYRDAAAAWSQDRLDIVEAAELPPADDATEEIKDRIVRRGFRSIVLQINYEETDPAL